MGRRGPAKTPSAINRARGNPGCRKMNDHEPQPDPSAPVCPPWLRKDAKTAWQQLVPQLREMGVLTRIDRNALARYCQLWARWREAELFLQEKGSVFPIKDDEGKVKYLQQLPQVAIAHKLADALTRLEDRFGMNPSARTGIVVNEGPKEADIDTFVASKPKLKIAEGA